MSDYIDISEKSTRTAMLEELRRTQQEYTARHEPYDFSNAWKDYNDLLLSMEQDLQNTPRKNIAERMESWARRKKGFDPKEYGKKERFELVTTRPWIEPVNLKTGITVPQERGVIEEYSVKGKGNTIVVFVPKEVLEARKKK